MADEFQSNSDKDDVGDKETVVFNKKYVEETLIEATQYLALDKKYSKILLEELSVKLSAVLPKLEDTALTEIDDLLYPNEVLMTPEIIEPFPKEEKKWLIKKCFSKFAHVFIRSLDDERYGFTTRIIDTTYLQLLQHTRENNSLILDLFLFVKSGNVQLLCLALKLLNLTFENQKKHIIKDVKYFGLYDIIWIKNILKHLSGTSSQNKIINWIQNKCTTYIQKFELEIVPHLECKHKYEANAKIKRIQKDIEEKNFNARFVQFVNMTHDESNGYFSFDIFFTFFMSARDEQEKIDRVKDFIKGSTDFYRRNSEEYIIYDFYSDRIKDMASTASKIINSFICNSKCSEEMMSDIEKCCDYEFEPYLTQNGHNSDLNISRATNKFDDSDRSNNDNDEPEYIIGKIVFTEIMKILHVLDIINTASQMLPKLFKIENKNDPLVNLNGSFELKCKSKLCFNQTPKDVWANKFLFRKCPFIYLPSSHRECFKEDLRKFINGEEIDGVVEDELYFVLNGTYKKDTSIRN